MVSCEDYLDVNVDPNNPTVVGPALILPVGQNYTARWIDTDRSVNHLGNMMMYNPSNLPVIHGITMNSFTWQARRRSITRSSITLIFSR
jgi:hypothetical protein